MVSESAVPSIRNTRLKGGNLMFDVAKTWHSKYAKISGKDD